MECLGWPRFRSSSLRPIAALRNKKPLAGMATYQGSILSIWWLLEAVERADGNRPRAESDFQRPHSSHRDCQGNRDGLSPPSARGWSSWDCVHMDFSDVRIAEAD